MDSTLQIPKLSFSGTFFLPKTAFINNNVNVKCVYNPFMFRFI